MKPLRWLLLIPAQLIFAALLMYIGTQADLLIFSHADAAGHGLPIFSAAALCLSLVSGAAVWIIAPILCIRAFRRKR